MFSFLSKPRYLIRKKQKQTGNKNKNITHKSVLPQTIAKLKKIKRFVISGPFFLLHKLNLQLFFLECQLCQCRRNSSRKETYNFFLCVKRYWCLPHKQITDALIFNCISLTMRLLCKFFTSASANDEEKSVYFF